MKTITVTYKLDAQLSLQVDDSFELTEENIHKKMCELTDEKLINGIESVFSSNGIDADAISICEFETDK